MGDSQEIPIESSVDSGADGREKNMR